MNKNRLLCCRCVSHMSDLFEVEQLDKTDLPVTSRLGPLMQTMIGNLNLVLVMVPCLGKQVLNLNRHVHPKNMAPYDKNIRDIKTFATF